MTRLALIGLGRWGKNFLKAAEKIKDCKITHLVSASQQTLAQFPDIYKKSTNYVGLDKSIIDGIIIATPGSTHFTIAKALITKKIPMLIEKPLTINYQEGLELQKLAKQTTTSIMAGHVYLYNPAYQKVKKIIPKIGKIRYISFKGYNYGPFRNDMSALWEWAPHGIAMSIDLLKIMPRTITAWAINTLRPKTNLYDTIYIRLNFAKNISCLLECGWLYPLKRRELIVCGTKSSLVFDDLADKKITMYENLGPIVGKDNIKEQLAKITYPQYNSQMPLESEVTEFVQVIKNNKKSKTDINHAVKVMKIINAAEASLSGNGKMIYLT